LRGRGSSAEEAPSGGNVFSQGAERISERYIFLDAYVSPSDTFPEAGARRVIRSFKGKVAEKVFNGKCPKGFLADLLKASRRKLEAVNAAVQLEDLLSRRAITSRHSLAIGADNIRSGSTTSSESAFAGRTAEPRTWKSSTTIRKPA
jgi:hypothetical protein